MPDNVETVSLTSIMSTLRIAGTCAVLSRDPRAARATALAHLVRQNHGVKMNTAFKCTAFCMGAEMEGSYWRNLLLPHGAPLADHCVFDPNILSMRQCMGTVRDSWKIFNECFEELTFSECARRALLESHRDIGMDVVPVEDLEEWMALMANFYEPIGLDIGLLGEDDDEADDDDDEDEADEDEADDGPYELAPAA